MGLDSAMATLGSWPARPPRAGRAPVILSRRESLTRSALSNVLSLAQDPQNAMAALQAVPTVAPSPSTSAVTPTRPASTVPTFGDVSQALSMRIGVDGEGHSEIAYLRCAARFLEVVGDRPVDQYTHKDLQDYISAMQYWPGNATKRAEMSNMRQGDPGRQRRPPFEANGSGTADLCRKHGISSATFYKWKASMVAWKCLMPTG